LVIFLFNQGLSRGVKRRALSTLNQKLPEKAGKERRRCMKRLFSLILAVGLVIAFAQFGFAQMETVVEKKATTPGSSAVESPTTTATVGAIDYENRTGMLKLPDGTKVTFKAGPEVRNFDQLKVGDQVLIRN
jgi:hypothetical protein